MIASLGIGLLTTFTVGLDWSLGDALSPLGLAQQAAEIGGLLRIKLSSLSGSLPFLIMLAVLLGRPAGLMGDRA